MMDIINAKVDFDSVQVDELLGPEIVLRHQNPRQ